MRNGLAPLLLLALAAPAAANDSMAELKTGGLSFLRSSDVTMAEEDLYISPTEVRVDYVFDNKSDQPIETVVAFPMPEIGGSPDMVVALDDPESDNFLGFTVAQDGKPIAPELQQRAMVGGLDMTSLLTEQNIPLLPASAKTQSAVQNLPPEVAADFVARGLVVESVYDAGNGEVRELQPLWTLQSTYWWKTTFPAKSKVTVSHRYRPSVGGTVAMSFIEDGKPAYRYDEYKTRYCIDDAFMKQAAKLENARKEGSKLMYVDNWLSYILTTGANWYGPIGRFHLTVDKGDAKNFISFCGEGVKKTGPTTFEMEKTDFYPERDLDILLLKPVEMEE